MSTTVPTLIGFDHIFADLLTGCSDAVASPSEAASLVRKLDCLAAAITALYAELHRTAPVGRAGADGRGGAGADARTRRRGQRRARDARACVTGKWR